MVPGGHSHLPLLPHLPSNRAHTWAKFTRIQWAGVTPPPHPGSPHPEPGAGAGSDGQREDLRHFEGTKGRGGPCSSVETGVGD